ncbi:hypothetical protein MIND_01379100 [Mycena indigotica]|uniref:Zn(2)-C6 fungal-type domain-containing protein n=1 Tax=Mycena indigotica TaxID=2126181 RepID=A0A8H6S0R9_9AGAR|nr:uncharacterized protein MIND_01379100 [Mycena indigotica]KAF7289180.1 hypothetical protein MIND_01379100 [Mycena indigotica]
MIADATLSQAGARSVASRPLKRGRACMNCRFLKIKCDGVKPVCGPCRKHPKDDECEYNDGPTRSRTKALEDMVQRLEARLHELEHPEETTPSVTLYDPYSSLPPPPPPGRLTIPQLTLLDSGHRSLPGTPFRSLLPRLQTPVGSQSSPESHLAPLSPPSTTASTPPLSLFGSHGHGPSPSPLGIFDSRAVAVATPDSSVASSLDLLDPQLCERLLHAFLPYASQFGFFLDLEPRRFMLRSQQYPPTSPNSAPALAITLGKSSPALLYTLCTFGAHLSPSRDRATEERFLFRALQACATSTADSNPQWLVHIIQAEVLLAYYFWRTGSLLRARVHFAAAHAFVSGSGLHKPREDAPILAISIEHRHESRPRSPYHSPPTTERRLLPPTDPIDAGERIRAVWVVSGLQQMLSVALDSPSEDLDVQVPWPREIEEYRSDWAEGIRGKSTMKLYLAGQETPQPNESMNAMLSKAQLLLHRVASLQAQAFKSTGVGQQAQAVVATFQSLSALVEALRTQLPLRYSSSNVSSRRSSYSPSHSSGSSEETYPQGRTHSPTYRQQLQQLSAPAAYSQSMRTQTHSPSYASEYQPSQLSSPDYHNVPMPLSSDPATDVDSRVTLAHDLLDGATLRLHDIFVYMYGANVDPSANTQAIRTAMGLLRHAATASARPVSPIVGIVWNLAITTLADELKRLRQQQQGWSTSDGEYEKELRGWLQEGLLALEAAARDSAVMRRELGRAREVVAASGSAL